MVKLETLTILFILALVEGSTTTVRGQRSRSSSSSSSGIVSGDLPQGRQSKLCKLQKYQ